MNLLLLYVGIAIGVSFLCSILEAVLLSISPSYITLAEQDGKAYAQKLRRYKEQIDRPLSAILSLNTIAHTVGAAGAGAQAAVVFKSIPVGVISAVLTIGILVFSEIVPKTIGAVHWKRLVPLFVAFLEPVIWLMWPFVKLSEGISRLLAPGGQNVSITRAELAAMAEQSSAEGVLHESESRIFGNLLRFNSINVRAIMTPRTVLFALPGKETVGEVVAHRDELRFSRIPVFAENRDQITGYVLRQDVLLTAARGAADTKLSEIQRELLAVPDTLALPALFDLLLDKREHLALVCDEFGGTSGVVSMEDLIETLLGFEIVDEVDSVEDMQEHARQRWLERAHSLGIAPDEGGPVDPASQQPTGVGPSPKIPPPDSTETPPSGDAAPGA
jgi:magnesium and cobalt exporter, CNNM family